jgi:hypothetical protein
MLLVPISEHVVDERLELPGASRSIAEAILGERRTEAATFLGFSTFVRVRRRGGAGSSFGGVAGRSLGIGGILGPRARLRWRVGHRGRALLTLG